MSDRSQIIFETVLNSEFISVIKATENVYQFRFKSRAANCYLVKGKARTIMIDVGLASTYPYLLDALNHLGCKPADLDMVILTHEHLDHIGAAHFFNGRTIMAAHRLAANKIELRDDFAILRKMFDEPNEPIHIDVWLIDGNTIDLGDFRLRVHYTPGHTSACISLFDPEKGLLFAADTLMAGGVMGGIFGSGSISDYIMSLELLKSFDAKILLPGHGRMSATPHQDIQQALGRSRALLSDTGLLFDALDARENFEPLMQSVRDLNKLDDG